MATIVEYLRISQDPEHQSLSPEVQQSGTKRLCETKRWPAPVKSYVDRDRSAWQRGVTREAFEQMLDDARAGLFTHIVAWDLDRLVRRMKDVERLIQLHE